ncbi:MAG TPA: hypothetical protein IAA88_03850 [Candidatus Avimuribaculum pullicola]|nr:hypothetical protein [Candidatus Avimuribaculum pullicola]
MNFLLKIGLLIAALALAVGVILGYAKNQVSPPENLEQADQYSLDFERMPVAASRAISLEAADDIYASAISQLDIYKKEGKMTADITASNLRTFASCYSKSFLNFCFMKFMAPEWKDSDLSRISSDISNLNSLKDDKKKPIITGTRADSVKIVAKVIADYYDARAVSRSLSYHGVSEARATIAKADAYARAKYLSQCKSLTTALGNVRNGIANSHYQYVLGQLNSMLNYNYRTHSEEEFNQKVTAVQRTLDDYNNNAASLYGSKRDLTSPTNRAVKHITDATDYYMNYY